MCILGFCIIKIKRESTPGGMREAGDGLQLLPKDLTLFPKI